MGLKTHYTLADADGNRRKVTVEWFEKRVRKSPGCWLWMGTNSGSKHKYGAVQLRKEANGHRVFTGAHRVAFELWRGPIPNRMCVLHSCDNPLCVNPDHLFLGTYTDNAQDMWRKGRHALPRKEDRPNFNKALMTPRAARRVIELRDQGVPIKEIVHRVFYAAVRATVSHRGWKSVRHDNANDTTTTTYGVTSK